MYQIYSNRTNMIMIAAIIIVVDYVVKVPKPPTKIDIYEDVGRGLLNDLISRDVRTLFPNETRSFLASRRTLEHVDMPTKGTLP